MSGARLVWIDMEMSGLDPDRERILEIAAIVTDGDLELVAEGPGLVVHQPDALLDAMDDWNKSHHAASGLVDRVRASEVSESEAEDLVLAFISEHVGQRKAPLAGNSVHQDRRFLARYMPKIDEYLHYRHVDVSTIKELCGRWYPDAYRHRPEKKNVHRALDDIRESIEELRFYRTSIFK
jgi:oligoribonuclease